MFNCKEEEDVQLERRRRDAVRGVFCRVQLCCGMSCAVMLKPRCGFFRIAAVSSTSRKLRDSESPGRRLSVRRLCNRNGLWGLAYEAVRVRDRVR